MKDKNTKFILAIIFSAFCFLFFSAQVSSQSLEVREEIQGKESEIQQIERQIQEFETQISDIRGEAQTLQNEIAKLNAEIGKYQLEIRRLQIGINQANEEIVKTNAEINDAEEKVSRHKLALGESIRLLDQGGNSNLVQILFKYENLSDFFNGLHDIEVTQENLRISIQNIKELKLKLEEKKEELQEKRSEFEQLKSFQELEKRFYDDAKREQDRLLRETRGREDVFQQLVSQKKTDIERIRSQISFLLQHGLSVEEVIKFGQLAAIRVGIRPAFLIAVLDVESALGRNVGRCYWTQDIQGRPVMHPTRDQPIFAQITQQLGINPDTQVVSCPGFSSGRRFGWGGAMGPAQFIPSTWAAYADEVSRLVGRTANPWNIEDAFTASAIKLARGGATAQTTAAERAASMAYYSGDPRCETNLSKSLTIRRSCTSYANAVQRKAAEIEKNL